MEICKQLVNSDDTNSQFLGAFFIHQTLRENINEISESKEIFLKYRDLIFHDLLEKLKSSNAIIIERICYSVAILMAVGIISHWETCVEDLIQFGKISKENCYLALIILQNIMKELNELQIAGKKMLRIKDVLIEKVNLINDFINLLLESFCANKANLLANSFEAKFLNQTLDLIHSWIKLDLNILKDHKLLSALFVCFSIENCEKISEIFSESICLSKSGKKYYLQNEYDVDVLYEKSDKLEINSIDIISEFLNVFISESIMGNAVSEESPIKKLLINTSNADNAAVFPKLNSDEKLLALGNFANVFASIFEFFPNLLFMKNALSSILLNSLFSFLAHKGRKISSRMFMAFNEIKEFVNRGYKLSNYSLPEKKEFCDFLIKICESIMFNCKLTTFYIPSLSQGKVLNDLNDIEMCYPNDALNNNFDNNELSISEYRKQAEEIFYDLFMVFLTNFQEEGVSYFFAFLYAVLDNSDIGNLQALASTDQKVFVIEVVLLLVNSIISCFEVADTYAKFLIDFASKIIGSHAAINEKLLCPFLKFMDAASPYIHKNLTLYSESVHMLTGMLKIKQIENVVGIILVQITEFSKLPSKVNFEFLYNIFIEEYDNLSSNTLGNLVESLANSIAVKENHYNLEERSSYALEISGYFKLVLGAAAQRAEKAFLVLKDNLTSLGINTQTLNFTQNPAVYANELNCGLNPAHAETIKMQFLRNFNVYNLLLKKAFFLDQKILIEIFHEVMRQIANIIDKSLRFFVKDVNFVKEVTKIFNKLATNLGIEILPYFDYINELMLFLYVNNPDNFYVLSVLKPLYSNAAVNSTEKKEFIANNFVELSELIKKNIIEVNKNNKLDIIIVLCYLWTTVLNAVDRLKVSDENVIYGFIDFILDAFKSVSEPSLNKAILSLLSNLISVSNIIPSQLIINKFKEIVCAVYGSLDNLVGGVLTPVNLIFYFIKFFIQSQI